MAVFRSLANRRVTGSAQGSSSVSQYRKSRQLWQEMAEGPAASAAQVVGARGLLSGRMPHSSGRRLPLVRLQPVHAVTTLAQLAAAAPAPGDRRSAPRWAGHRRSMAAEPVAQEHVEPWWRPPVLGYVLLERDTLGSRSTVDGEYYPIVVGRQHPLEKDRLDGFLPVPGRQREVAEGRRRR
jgi:hypothetical protein